MSNLLHAVQSRIKYRKVLGVGESSDGRFPRSKIVQLLGNDGLDKTAIEQGDYPRGLRLFQWLTCFLFAAVGMINVFSPQHFYRLVVPAMKDPNSLVRQIMDELQLESYSEKGQGACKFTHTAALQSSLNSHFKSFELSVSVSEAAVRLYGTACLSLSAYFFIVAVASKNNRRAIRIALFVEALYLIADILVTLITVKLLDTENKSWFVDPLSLFWLTSYKIGGVLFCVVYCVVTHPPKGSANHD